MTRTILITGASGKLGRVMVEHFLEQGERVIAISRSNDKLTALTERYGSHSFVGLQADLSHPDGCAVILDSLSRLGLAPDGLVNNARNIDFLKLEPGGRVNRENFAGEFLVDVIVPYELTLTLANAPGSRLRRVVNIGSQYGSVAANPLLYTDHVNQSPLHYGVCKAALVHLTRELAVRLAPREILVNCLAFGGVEGRVDAEFKARYARLVPLGRMLRESEIAGPVDMLLSDGISGMTGQTMAVDGGWTIW